MSHPPPLSTFRTGLTAVVIGATGGIGAALADALERSPAAAAVHRLSRRGGVDLTDEASLAAAAARIGAADIVICAAGLLHDDAVSPEKTWASFDPDAAARAFAVNAIGPALAAKHFLPILPKGRKTAFAALSARVGSISDNRLGGWMSYRASKAALNQFIRTLGVELARKNPQALIVGLHPGTVDTALSQPFQRGARLFTPADAAAHLLGVLDGLTPEDSGGCFAWDGARIPD
ncbi:MAG: SDR family NAD(P)-dependent oxidoreductase [Pseudomonadota bacterium]